MSRFRVHTIGLLSVVIAIGLFPARDVRAQLEKPQKPPVRLLQTLQHERAVTSLAWSPNGSSLATMGLMSPDITIWDAKSGRLVQRLKRQIGYAEPLAFSRDGHFLITSTTEKNNGAALTLLDTKSWKPVRHVSGLFADQPPIISAARLLSVAANRDRLAYVHEPDPRAPIEILNMATWEQDIIVTTLGKTPTALAFAPNGDHLAVGTIRGEIALIDLASQEVVRTIRAYPGSGVGIATLAYSADGRLVASGHNGLLGSEWAADGKMKTREAPSAPIRIWNISNGEMVSSFPGGPHAVRGLAWSPDGSCLSFSATEEGKHVVRLWCLSTDAQLTVMTFPSTVFSIQFSPDGRLLAAAGGNIARIVELPR